MLLWGEVANLAKFARFSTWVDKSNREAEWNVG